MIDCPNGGIRDTLPDFVHGRLDAASRAEVATHVDRCAACAAELGLLRELHAELSDIPPVDVARIVGALPKPSGRIPGAVPATRRSWNRLDWRAAAAITALVIGGGSALLVGRGAGPGEPTASRVAQQNPDRPTAAPPAPGVSQLAAADLSMDADLAEVSAVELEELLRDLEEFDGLPAVEPEPALAAPGVAGAGR